MIASLLLCLPAAPAPAPAAPVLTLQETSEVDAKIAAAGEDLEALWTLASELKAAGQRPDFKKVCKRILELDDTHEKAHKGLNHHFYDNQWFESYTALSRYRKAKEAEMKAKGLVRMGDQWVPEADVTWLRMGWVKTDSGKWVKRSLYERQILDAKAEKEGWRLQDRQWITPDEFDKLDQDLYKCGEDWLPLEEAEKYHAELGQWWEVPGANFVVLSTLDRLGIEWIHCWADQTVSHLERALGKRPERAPELVVLNSTDQYNVFASGEQGVSNPSEASGFSSLHYAYVADAWIDMSTRPPEFRGTGVAFWARNDESLNAWGHMAVRHAAAHSYMEALDPSWNTVSQAMAGGGQGYPVEEYWAEKQIPRWMRYGMASYVERFIPNPRAGNGGDPMAWRNWSIANLKGGGELTPMETLLAFELSLDAIPQSTRMIHEAGLLMHYILDGDDQAVRSAHEEFKQAFAKGEGVKEAVTALEDAIKASEDKIKALLG